MGSSNGSICRRKLKSYPMISFDIISSGSKGNATIVFVNDHTFLIDFGITLKQVEAELALFNKTINDVEALFVTHNHADHYKGIKAISPKKQFALEGTLPSSLSNVMELFKTYVFGEVKVTPIQMSHDAKNPCGFIIEGNKEKLVYITDTGAYLSINTPYVKNPDYLIIESNHDISMELKCNRPMELKQRIMSDYGHLCNEDSAFATLEIIGEKTKEIILAHLSEEANTPEVALSAYEKVFKYAHKDISKYKIRCAMQYEHLLGGHYED